MSSPQIRITVYRESAETPSLREHIVDGEDRSDRFRRLSLGELHEEIYCWSLACDERVVSDVSSRLVTAFAEQLPQEKRRPALLADVAKDLYPTSEPEWSISLGPEDASFDLPPAMVNTSRALLEHLRWISETFADLPGTHIVIR